MSDAKITELTELTDPTGEDLLAVVDDVAGTPIIKKTTIQKIADLFASLTQTLTNKTLTTPVINGLITGTFGGYYNSVSNQAIINGGFTVNQRGYATSGTLASGAYGHDRWKAGAGGGDYTFTQLASSTQITIEAGKTLIQVIEDKNVVGGTYTLSWTGTAQARAGVDTATPAGGYADSPLTISAQTAGTVMSVEFDAGTLGEVQLNIGGVALPFQPKSYAQEEHDCLRYAYVPGYGSSLEGRSKLFSALASSTTVVNCLVKFPVPMRTTPTLTATATEWALLLPSTAHYDVSALAIEVVGDSKDSCIINAISTGISSDQMYWFETDATAGRIMIFDAEL